MPLPWFVAAPTALFMRTPERAAELGRKGGVRNRKVYLGGEQEVSIPTSVGEVKKMLAETMAGVRSGTIDPKIGSTVAYVAAALLRAFEAEPPVPPERPSIYTALQYRTAGSAGITETGGQKEVRAPGQVATPALLMQGGKAEVAPRKKDLGYEILDLP